MSTILHHFHPLEAAIMASKQKMPNTPTSRCCQVAGCDADMDTQKPYNQKKRCCAAHMAAQAVLKRGCGTALFRYCFQCGKLEELSRFDGAHRSCRERLVQRKRRQVARRASSQSLLLLPQAQSPAGSEGASPASMATSCPPSPTATPASPASTSSGGSPHLPGSCCVAPAPGGCSTLVCAGSDASQLSCYMSGCMDELLQQIQVSSQVQGPSQPCKSLAAAPSSDVCYEQLLDQLMQGMAESGVVFVEAPDSHGSSCSSSDDEALAEQLARLLEQELHVATAELAAAASPALSQQELQLQSELVMQMEQARKAASLTAVVPVGPAQHAHPAAPGAAGAQWQQARLQALRDQFNSLQALLQQLQACMTSMQLA